MKKTPFRQFIDNMINKYGENWQNHLTPEEYQNGLLTLNDIQI